MKKFEFRGCFEGKDVLNKKRLNQLATLASEKLENHHSEISTDNFLLTLDSDYVVGSKKYLALAHYYKQNKLRIKLYHFGEKIVDAFFIAP